MSGRLTGCCEQCLWCYVIGKLVLQVILRVSVVVVSCRGVRLIGPWIRTGEMRYGYR